MGELKGEGRSEFAEKAARGTGKLVEKTIKLGEQIASAVGLGQKKKSEVDPRVMSQDEIRDRARKIGERVWANRQEPEHFPQEVRGSNGELLGYKDAGI